MKRVSLFSILAFIMALCLTASLSGGKSMVPLPPPPPLPPILSDLAISPFVAIYSEHPSGILHENANKLGDNVTIRFVVTNTDNQSFVYTATMQIGNVTLMIDVELEPYETKTVSHTITPDNVGFYDVKVDGLTGCFYVWPLETKPAEFIVSDLTIFTEIEEGADITIFVNVSNVGEVEGAYKVDLTVEGEVVYSEDVTLAGGETKEVPLWIMEGLPEGTYHVEVNGLEGSFEVVRAAKPVGGGLTDLVPQAIILSLIFLIGFFLLLRFVLHRWIHDYGLSHVPNYSNKI